MLRACGKSRVVGVEEPVVQFEVTCTDSVFVSVHLSTSEADDSILGNCSGPVSNVLAASTLFCANWKKEELADFGIVVWHWPLQNCFL